MDPRASLRSLLLLGAAFTAFSCVSQRDQVDALEGRIAALEDQVQRGTSKSAPAVLAPPATHPQFTDAVSVELGASEFHDGDTIVITEVRGTKATLQLGQSYVVTGRYHLSSRDSATLLLSVTATNGGVSSPTPESTVRVARGDGEFTLTKRLDSVGYPHLTFYGTDGQPVSGVYFGTGDWLLKRKDWRYDAPSPKPSPPQQSTKPIELL